MSNGLFDSLKRIGANAENGNITATKALALERAAEIDRQTGLSTLLGEDPRTVQAQLAAEILFKESRDPGKDVLLDTIEHLPVVGLPLKVGSNSRKHDASAAAQLFEENPTTLSPIATQFLKTAASIYINAMEHRQDPGEQVSKRIPAFKRILGK